MWLHAKQRWQDGAPAQAMLRDRERHASGNPRRQM
jgi:hypothetical protein